MKIISLDLSNRTIFFLIFAQIFQALVWSLEFRSISIALWHLKMEETQPMKPIKKIDKSDLIPDDSGSVELLGFPIHWERYGSGPQIVLLIPGALGTAKSDFYQQLRGPLAFDLNRYTFIAVELPGWGQSRPPKRPYGIDVYDTDVKCCLQLMEVTNVRFDWIE